LKGSNQRGSTNVGHRSFRLFLSILAIIALAAWWLSPPSRSKSQTVANPGLRGKPIRQEGFATNLLSSETNTTVSTSNRPKRPKPASFQKRAVESQLQAWHRGDTNPITVEPIAPPKFRGSKSLPPPPPEPESSELAGFQRLGFERLSGFEFLLDARWIDGSTNLAQASAEALALIPEDIRALDRAKVAIRGFILPLKMDEGLAVEFLLVRDQNLCCYGVVPKINEWINVTFPRGIKPVLDQPVTVCGELQVGDWRENGYLVSLYRLQAEKAFGP